MAGKLQINKEDCLGCGLCVDLCPESFELSEDGTKAKIKESRKENECEKEAIDSCPVNAIKIE